MLYNNDNSVKALKLWLITSGFMCFILMAILIFLQQFLALAFVTGIFLVILIVISFLNFQYIQISESKNKLVIRYYSVFSVNRTYQSIEIPVEFLRKVSIRKFFFGLKWDLRLSVLIRKGVAEYPPVSLSAVPFRKRRKLVDKLTEMILIK